MHASDHLVGRRDYQASVFDAFRPDNHVRDHVDIGCLAAQDDDFEAGILVEMHMGRRHDHAEMRMLDTMQSFLHIAFVMIEYDGERAYNFGSRNFALFLNERVAYQIADDFAAVFGHAATSHQPIEPHEQPLGHGYGKTYEIAAVDMAVRHRSHLNEADRDAGSVGRILLERIFRVGEQGARFVEQLLDGVELVINGSKTRIASLMRQFVRPSALESDMVVYLGNHLIELAYVYSVGAHVDPSLFFVAVRPDWYHILLYERSNEIARVSVRTMPRSNIFEAGAASIAELFEGYLERPSANGSCIVLVVSSQRLADNARDALEKSFDALGYGRNLCTFATLATHGDDAFGGGETLDPQALFLLVEGLDPLFVITTDGGAVQTLGSAYRTEFAHDSAARVFGRSSVAFDDLEALLETDAGKQKAWHLLKNIPRRN